MSWCSSTCRELGSAGAGYLRYTLERCLLEKRLLALYLKACGSALGWQHLRCLSYLWIGCDLLLEELVLEELLLLLRVKEEGLLTRIGAVARVEATPLSIVLIHA